MSSLTTFELDNILPRCKLYSGKYLCHLFSFIPLDYENDSTVKDIASDVDYASGFVARI